MHQSIPAETTPPPPRTVWDIFTLFTCPHGRAFAAACSPGGQAFVNIGLLLRPFVAHGEKPRVSFVVCQNGRLLNTLIKQILYYIILLLNVGFQV
jgi:hypothetical protein